MRPKASNHRTLKADNKQIRATTCKIEINLIDLKLILRGVRNSNRIKADSFLFTEAGNKL
jgi:hypothetical protein